MVTKNEVTVMLLDEVGKSQRGCCGVIAGTGCFVWSVARPKKVWNQKTSKGKGEFFYKERLTQTGLRTGYLSHDRI